MFASYTNQNISKDLLKEIKNAIKSVKAFGSVEIYVQDNIITQITTRSIRKTTGVFKKRIKSNSK